MRGARTSGKKSLTGATGAASAPTGRAEKVQVTCWRQCSEVASLIKRWPLGIRQGVVDAAHLPNYVNGFAFRFNRLRSRAGGA